MRGESQGAFYLPRCPACQAGERHPARSSDWHRATPVVLPAPADPVRPLHNAPRSAGAESIERRATGGKAARVQVSVDDRRASERWTPEIAAVATTPRSAWLPRRRNRGRVRGELRASSPDLPVRPATHALTPCRQASHASGSSRARTTRALSDPRAACSCAHHEHLRSSESSLVISSGTRASDEMPHRADTKRKRFTVVQHATIVVSTKKRTGAQTELTNPCRSLPGGIEGSVARRRRSQWRFS
jgi:hypothetical protein